MSASERRSVETSRPWIWSFDHNTTKPYLSVLYANYEFGVHYCIAVPMPDQSIKYSDFSLKREHFFFTTKHRWVVKMGVILPRSPASPPSHMTWTQHVLRSNHVGRKRCADDPDFLVPSGEEMHTALEWGNYIYKKPFVFIHSHNMDPGGVYRVVSLDTVHHLPTARPGRPGVLCPYSGAGRWTLPL